MNLQVNLENVLFLDIETVPAAPRFSNLDERFSKLWKLKADLIRKTETDTPETLWPRAGIYAEFGKVICISVGIMKGNLFRMKSFAGKDEKTVLEEFSGLLKSLDGKREIILCAHNGKEFDFPYLSRRMLINRMPLPKPLDISGKKPWEIPHLDTMDLWKFGDYKSYTSLDLLSAVFNIDTPKDDIDGSQVGHVFYQENDLERIKAYCQKDTLTVAQILLSILGKPLILPENVVIVD